MQCLHLNLDSPAEYLAADEVLLDWHEAGHGRETLILWEPKEAFVVVGYANKVSTEVNQAACEKRGVPILRRCSGGGTVVQLPGGLNYGLILPILENGPTRNISATNRYVMERNRDAIQSLMRPAGLLGVFIRGHTDLTLGQPAQPPASFLKFAGNSQRRRRQYLIFHGTFLLNCDLAIINELLRMPSLEPDYRLGRSHDQFITNLNMPAQTVKEALAREWGAEEMIIDPPVDEIRKLAREKYSTREWNYKF